MTDISYQIMIDASPEVVFAHLTQREGLLRWVGVEAVADPVAGGDLSWTHQNGATMIGRFVELDPPHRVRFTYGWKDDLMGIPPESTTVDIVLTRDHDGTRLELSHRQLPPDHSDDHRQGWDHFLTTLAARIGATT